MSIKPSDRNLITVFSSLDGYQCRYIDESLMSFTDYVRLPLFLMASAAGVLSSLSTSFVKGASITFEAGDSPFQLFVFALFAICNAVYQLYVLNNIMALYEQVMIIPIYQTSLIIMTFCAGAVILDEKKMYTTFELSLPLICSLISIVGVWIIVTRPTNISDEDEDGEDEQKEEICE